MGTLYNMKRMERRTNCGYGRNDLTQLQFVKDRSFPCRVEANHQDAHLLLPPELIEQFRKCETHDCCCAELIEKKRAGL